MCFVMHIGSIDEGRPVPESGKPARPDLHLRSYGRGGSKPHPGMQIYVPALRLMHAVNARNACFFCAFSTVQGFDVRA